MTSNFLKIDWPFDFFLGWGHLINDENDDDYDSTILTRDDVQLSTLLKKQ